MKLWILQRAIDNFDGPLNLLLPLGQDIERLRPAMFLQRQRPIREGLIAQIVEARRYYFTGSASLGCSATATARTKLQSE